MESPTTVNRFLEWLGKLFSRFPVSILVLTLGFAITMTWVGLVQHGFPEFGDPYLGFQTRFTQMSNRLVSLENLRLEVNKLDILENYPGEKISEKETRRRRRSLLTARTTICTSFPMEEYGRVGLELGKASPGVLSQETLSLLCYFQKLILEIPSYVDVCELEGGENCCPMWSLPNYVARWVNKTDCVDIQGEDVANFKQDFSTCNTFYNNVTQDEDCLFHRSNCPSICHHGGLIHSAFQHTIDSSSLFPNKTKFVMVVLPIPKLSKEERAINDFQKRLWDLRTLLPADVVTLRGFDFGAKDAIFKRYLVSDLRYVAFASLFIFAVISIFTKSLFVSLISFGVLLLSLGVSYFVYMTVLTIPYFPFMNMLVAIIILGIGTDTTLIVSSAREKAKHVTVPTVGGDSVGIKKRREHAMIQTLQETTSTLFITTCTTAAAFFASLTSSITTIRCFSIFAGMTIVTSFLLLFVCVPISLQVSDSIWLYSMSLLPSSSRSKFLSKFIQFSKNVYRLGNRSLTSDFLLSCKKRSGFPSPLILWVFSFLVCACVLVWASFLLFWAHGVQLPNSEQFQLFASSHPIEIFERVIKPAFQDPRSGSGAKISLYLVWGVEDLDDGSGLDPNNVGKLRFDSTFSLSPPRNQRWMKKLCRRIQELSFYDPVSNAEVGLNLDGCFMETFVSWMRRDCRRFLGTNQSYAPCCTSSKFPYEESTFKKCLGLAARDVYRTPSLYFQPDIAGPKFFTRPNGLLGDTTPENTLATFAVRIQTNVTYSVVYEKMEAFHKAVEGAFEEMMADAPPGLENGFCASEHLDFYDLQKSLLEETWTSLFLSIGLCFLLLLGASRSFLIAFGAVTCIFAIVLVTGGLLVQFLSWKLGVFESIAVTTSVGLSDFTAHHSIEFSKANSVAGITRPTFFSAVSTVAMGLSLFLFSDVLVYQQIGSFFFVLVLTSWIYSISFLSPLLRLLQAVMRRTTTVARRLCLLISQRSRKDETDDVSSHSDLIVENVGVTSAPDKKPHPMMDKWRQLKKLGQETTV